MLRRYVHWPCIRIAELHLIYAEALCQSSRGSMDKAIAQVDIVRARVGMKGLAECNPDKIYKVIKMLLLKNFFVNVLAN